MDVAPQAKSAKELVLEDLARSGITELTAAAMRISVAKREELPPEAKFGYNLIYFDIHGNPIDYRRIKLIPELMLGDKKVKYVQLAGSIAHIYLPPMVAPEVWQDPSIPIIITEGEKKAAAAAQFGFPTIGLGGVDAWRNRTFGFKTDKIKEGKNKNVSVKIASGEQAELLQEQVAPELLDIVWEGREVRFFFDTEPKYNPHVLRAKFDLACWMEERGAIVEDYILPPVPGEKVGLDDFLVAQGPDKLRQLIEQGGSFPSHPNLVGWIHRQLDGQTGRKVQRKVARAVVAALDERGQRFKDEAGNYYYFDQKEKVLYDFRWGSTELKQFRLSGFGTYLQTQFGIGTSDTAVLQRIADLFTAREPIHTVKPSKVFAVRGDALYFQLSDSRAVRVTAQSIDHVDNGTDGVLFRSNRVEPIDEEVLRQAMGDAIIPQNFWIDALSSYNLDSFNGLDHTESRILLAALFHLSPYLLRWRGMMLPIELAVAEPGSGKTFLYNLRRGILTGRPSLDNMPTTPRDWVAALTDAPGMWIADNVGDIQREMRDHVSDEAARIVTDPRPTTATRQLYTTAENVQIPIDCTFAFTTIRSPFFKPDFFQRAVTFRLRAIEIGHRDSNWYTRRLEERPRWVAEQLLVTQQFFRLVQERWDPKYLSGNRLVNFEQALKLMVLALGFEEQVANRIVRALPTMTQKAILDQDPAMEALSTFVQEWKGSKQVRYTDIIEWALIDVEGRFRRNKILESSISLGRYINMFKHDIEHSVGLKLVGKNLLEIVAVPEQGVSG